MSCEVVNYLQMKYTGRTADTDVALLILLQAT